MSVNKHLKDLQNVMYAQGYDAYIIPSSDPHQSEYVAEYWRGRAWISGFTGSMGYVAITASHAGVWTDSRYFLQCEMELQGTNFAMHKQGVQGAPEHIDWLCQNLPLGSRVACDGSLFSVEQVWQMQRKFEVAGMHFVTDADLLSAVWHDRPALPSAPIFEHDVQYAGRSRTEKIDAIRQKMREHKAAWHLVTTLDDIGWTLNLRGSDVACNPVFVAYLIIGLEKSYLFTDISKISTELKHRLNDDAIFVKPYDAVADFMALLPNSEYVVVDTANANFALYNTMNKAQIVEAQTFSILMKAIKNSVEIKHIRSVMEKDGVALVRAFRWLEKILPERTVTEHEFAMKLAECRSEMPLYYGESFDAIIGYEGNGAIVHYHPSPTGSANIRAGKGILLVDSGGQYHDGTTDITRTVALGEPDEDTRRICTLVLKGHIALAIAQFPAGTRGIQLDILARQYLWQVGLNYGHGTGHGVGFFMNVHEPPQGFAPGLSARGTTPQMIGMYSSNEPGFYREGVFGYRVENLVLCTEADTPQEFGQFLKFETVTLFPIDTKLVDADLLTRDERKWLNAYHREVYARLSTHLNADEKAWLRAKCERI